MPRKKQVMTGQDLAILDAVNEHPDASNFEIGKRVFGSENSGRDIYKRLKVNDLLSLTIDTVRQYHSERMSRELVPMALDTLTDIMSGAGEDIRPADKRGAADTVLRHSKEFRDEITPPSPMVPIQQMQVYINQVLIGGGEKE